MVLVKGADKQLNFIALAVFSFVMAVGLFVYFNGGQIVQLGPTGTGYYGYLTVTKTTNPAGDPTSFQITVSSGESFPITGGQSIQLSLPEGTYTVNENNPGNEWTQNPPSCAVTITAGTPATCAFVNTKTTPPVPPVATTCGDGIVQEKGTDGIAGNADDEQCDANPPETQCTPYPSCGPSSSCTYCGSSCKYVTISGPPCPPPTIDSCGDGIIDGQEKCDNGLARNDGTTIVNGVICNSDCTIHTPTDTCGDSIIQSPEACDNGDADNGGNNGKICSAARDSACSYCDGDCKRQTVTGPHCGDSIVSDWETCDDGNSVNNDACPNNCILPSTTQGESSGTGESGSGGTPNPTPPNPTPPTPPTTPSCCLNPNIGPEFLAAAAQSYRPTPSEWCAKLTDPNVCNDARAQIPNPEYKPLQGMPNYISQKVCSSDPADCSSVPGGSSPSSSSGTGGVDPFPTCPAGEQGALPLEEDPGQIGTFVDPNEGTPAPSGSGISSSEGTPSSNLPVEPVSRPSEGTPLTPAPPQFRPAPPTPPSEEDYSGETPADRSAYRAAVRRYQEALAAYNRQYPPITGGVITGFVADAPAGGPCEIPTNPTGPAPLGQQLPLGSGSGESSGGSSGTGSDGDVVCYKQGKDTVCDSGGEHFKPCGDEQIRAANAQLGITARSNERASLADGIQARPVSESSGSSSDKPLDSYRPPAGVNPPAPGEDLNCMPSDVADELPPAGPFARPFGDITPEELQGLLLQNRPNPSLPLEFPVIECTSSANCCRVALGGHGYC